MSHCHSRLTCQQPYPHDGEADSSKPVLTSLSIGIEKSSNDLQKKKRGGRGGELSTCSNYGEDTLNTYKLNTHGYCFTMTLLQSTTIIPWTPTLGGEVNAFAHPS